jgi:hypothetical protein
VGWQAAAERFRERCLESAPRPGAELEVEEESEIAGDPSLAVAQ